MATKPKQQAEDLATAAPPAPRDPVNLAEASSRAAEPLADGEVAEFKFGGQKYVVRREGDATVLENRGG